MLGVRASRMIGIIFKLLATLTALATTVLLTVAPRKSGLIVLGTVLGLIKVIVLSCVPRLASLLSPTLFVSLC